MKLNTIIVDDEPGARTLLKSYLTHYPYIRILSEVGNGIDAVSEINEKRPELIFLDMHMPDLHGLRVVESLTYDPRVVFSTAHDYYAIKAFEVNAFDYLLKPYTKERFDRTMLKLLSSETSNINQNISLLREIEFSKKNSNQFLVAIEGKMIGLKVSEIIWLEAKGNYTIIHTFTKGYLSKHGISDLELKLPKDIFIRIHRSKVININFIQEVYRTISGLNILLSDGTLHKVSRSYLDEIRWYIL